MYEKTNINVTFRRVDSIQMMNSTAFHLAAQHRGRVSIAYAIKQFISTLQKFWYLFLPNIYVEGLIWKEGHVLDLKIQTLI